MHIRREWISAHGATQLVDDFVAAIERGECSCREQSSRRIRGLLRERRTSQGERLIAIAARERGPRLVEGGLHATVVGRLNGAIQITDLDDAGRHETVDDTRNVELGASQCRGDRAQVPRTIDRREHFPFGW